MKCSGQLFKVLGAVWLLLAGAVQAAETWRLEKDADGIQIYSRAVEGQSIREIRGVTRVPARLSAVVAVIDDVAASPKLSDVLSEPSVVKRQSPTSYLVYMVLKMPWPLDDRDMVNQREIRQDPKSLVVTVSSRSSPDAVPPHKGRVRILQSRQEWVLTPQGKDQTLAEMSALTDPNGPIPASVINAMSVTSPYDCMKALRAMATAEPYRSASLPFVREPEGK